ncbi:MAG TPA: hypothetical protein VGB07_19370 [Blastocatellia bacterium]
MKNLLVLMTAIIMVFGLSIPQNGFGQTNSAAKKTDKKIHKRAAKPKVSSKLGVLLDGKTVKEMTLKDGTKLDADTIKKDSKMFKVEGNLLKYKEHVVQSFMLNDGGSTSFREECSCYPPVIPPPPIPHNDSIDRSRHTPRTRP